MKELTASVAKALREWGAWGFPVDDPELYHETKGELEEEFGVPVVSKSRLVDFMKDAYGMKWREEHGARKRSAALEVGSMVDALTFTPRAAKYWAIDAPDRRSKVWKDGAEEARRDGLEPVLLADYERARRVAEAVRGSIERRWGEFTSQFAMWAYVHEIEGQVLPCDVILTGMIDALPDDGGAPIVDLKTTGQPLVVGAALARNIAEYGYGVQAAVYEDLYEAVRKVRHGYAQPRGFEFLYASVEEPVRLRWVRMREEDVELYRARYRAALRRFGYAWNADDWGGEELPEMEYEVPGWDAARGVNVMEWEGGEYE